MMWRHLLELTNKQVSPLPSTRQFFVNNSQCMLRLKNQLAIRCWNRGPGWLQAGLHLILIHMISGFVPLEILGHGGEPDALDPDHVGTHFLIFPLMAIWINGCWWMWICRLLVREFHGTVGKYSHLTSSHIKGTIDLLGRGAQGRS